MNLLVGRILNSMPDAHTEESNAATDECRADMLARLEAIEKAFHKK